MKALAHVILHQLLFAVWLLAMWVLIFQRVLMTVQMTMQIRVATMMPLI